MEGNKKTITYYKSKIIDTFAKYIYNFDYAVMGSRLFYFERV